MPRSVLAHAVVLVSGAVAAAAALTIAALPAAADPAFAADLHTSAFVTQLGLSDGHGRLTVQMHIGSDAMMALEVDIPAGLGQWRAAPSIDVPELGVHCIGGPGPDLRYQCGSPSAGATPLPMGNYGFALPVARVGDYAGLWGTTSVDRPSSDGQFYTVPTDTFPVVDADTDSRSTAEATFLDTNWVRGAGVLSETITVRPGESVWAVDTTLPAGAGVNWTLTQWTVPAERAGTSLAQPALYCHLLANDDGTSVVRCSEWDTVRQPMPAGRFTIAPHLSAGSEAGSSALGTIGLMVGDRPSPTSRVAVSPVQDTFQWRPEVNNL